jgi:hypothetical protein
MIVEQFLDQIHVRQQHAPTTVTLQTKRVQGITENGLTN